MLRASQSSDPVPDLRGYYADPYRFSVEMFPWGQVGSPLEHHAGPDTWQKEVLRAIGEAVRSRGFNGHTPVKPIRIAISSGHGVGKSVLAAMVVLWLLATRPHCRGTSTANTGVQLRDKTWATLLRWAKLCAVRGMFDEPTSDRMWVTGHKESWAVAAATCREENSEAFAGQHAADSTSFYVFDESSAIPDSIWDVAEGGLTDGEPLILALGNATRNTGRFHEVCFGSLRERWQTWCVDARTSAFTNKAQIQEWIDDYGEDSDFVRVRVLGLPPRASDLQFISQQLVVDAARREVEPLNDDPVICGLDVARGGSAATVFRFRRGVDARSFAPVRIVGEDGRDSMAVAAKAADILEHGRYDGQRVAMMFVDASGGSVGGPIADRLVQLGYGKRVTAVQFGGPSPSREYLNMRAYMWGRMRDWLTRGGIPARDLELEADLGGPQFRHNNQDKIVLEPKDAMQKRGVASPDDGDALALTFAMPVGPGRSGPKRRGRVAANPESAGLGWMS